jgi:uncharacterized membrane protein
MAKSSKQISERPQTDRLARVRKVFLLITAVIALAGLTDATYLTVSHLSGVTSVCGESHGCSEVLGSTYATFRGIPTAAFGAIGYFAVFSAAMLALFGYRSARTFLSVVIAAMFVATLWFLYLQAFVIHAFCPFCLLSAAFVFCLAGLALAYPPER